MKHQATIVILSILLAACSPGYVIQAAWEQSKILLAREQISEIINDPNTSIQNREKLNLILAAREFAKAMSLSPGDSFTQYSEIDKDTLAWVVMGARPDSFELYTWWFPIVGSVPYKGYFDKADAISAARDLESEGFETWVRGTDAISTLGWFNDPVLSTILKQSPTRIVNIVIHETVHATVWIPGSVDFNESLANFVGVQGSLDFFKSRSSDLAQTAENDLAREFELHDVISNLTSQLTNLYQSELPKAEKLSRRSEIFDSVVTPWRLKYPNASILGSINNAEIMQLRIYLTKLDLFRELYRRTGRDWSKFMNEIRFIKANLDTSDDPNPFSVLRRRLEELPAFPFYTSGQ